MSEENAKLVGPDFAEGVAVADLTEGGMILGQVAGEAVVLARNGGALFAIGRSVPIITVRSPRGSSSPTPSAAHGTTPASACAAGRRCMRQRSIRSRAGGSSNTRGRFMSGKSLSPPDGRHVR